MTIEPENRSALADVAEATEKKSPQECPLCRKGTVASFRPFCSKKCKMIDLYKWVSGHYVIPGDPTDVVNQEEKEAKEEWEDSWKEKDL